MPRGKHGSRRVHILSCMHARMYTNFHACMRVCTQTCAYVHKLSRMHARMYINVHACMRVCTQTCAYVHKLSCMHARTEAQPLQARSWLRMSRWRNSQSVFVLVVRFCTDLPVQRVATVCTGPLPKVSPPACECVGCMVFQSR